MKKRLLASLLALIMVLSMFPTALAAEDPAPADDFMPMEELVPADVPQESGDPIPWTELSPAEGLESLHTQDSETVLPQEEKNGEAGVWKVGTNAELNQAVAAIEALRDQNGLTEATIALTADIKLEQLNVGDDEAGDNYFAGIEGVTVTLTSADKAEGEEGYHLTNFGLAPGNYDRNNAFGENGSGNARFLIGPVIFDQITLCGNKTWLFAQGHPVVFTENFRNLSKGGAANDDGVISVVGGMLGKQIRQMGTGFESYTTPGMNSDGTPSARKSFSGNVNHDTFGPIPACAEAVQGTSIKTYGGCFGTIIGGSYNGYVLGDTHVTVALDPDETYGYGNIHNVHNVYGGSVFNGKEHYDNEWGTTRGVIYGDTHVDALSGTFGTIWGGSSAHFSNNTTDDVGEIWGDTYVTVGQNDGMEARFNDVFGGGIRSTIGQKVKILDKDGWFQEYRYFGGNTHVTINETAVGYEKYHDQVSANIHGGGDMDLIWGTTEVILNGGGYAHWVFAGGSNSDYERQARIYNMIPNAEGQIPQTAAHIVVNGGTWNEIYSCHEMYVGTQKMQWIRGDVVVDFNGGTVNSFCLSGPRTAIGITDGDYVADKLGSSSGAEAPESVEADSILNVNGGKFGGSVPAIRGYRYKSYEGNTDAYGRVTGKRIVNFRNNVSVSLWGIQSIDEINVDNTAEAIVKWYSEDYPALDRCGDLNISKGTIALAGENTLKGNLTIQQGGTLALPTKNATSNVPNGVLNCERAEGVAGGLATIDVYQGGNGYLIPRNPLVRPTVNEVYVRAKALGTGTETDVTPPANSLMLDLINNEPDLYVEYATDNGTYHHIWRIAQDSMVQVVTVKYFKYKESSGTWASNGTDKSVVVGQKVGALPDNPTRTGYEFAGWYLTEDGSGTEFTADTVISADLVKDGVVPVYGQWEPIVTFNANGGSWADGVTTNTVVAGDNGKVTPPATDPTYGDKTFAGWYTAADGGDQVNFDTAAFNVPTTLYAHWTERAPDPTYKVTYTDGVDGEEVFADQVTSGLTMGAATPEFSGTPSRDGYTFKGWLPEVAATVTRDVTYVAQWSKNSSGGGGGDSVTTHYILHYESNGGTEYKDERYARNTVVKLDKVPAREGYTFTGWYADEELTERITSIKMTFNKTVYAGWEATGVPNWLNGEDHFAYVIGYTDGTVRPQAQIARSEVAAIFFRLLRPEIREEYLTDANPFDDVNEEDWYSKAVSTLYALDIFKGRTATAFVPDAPITRAEFAVICARFDTGRTDGESEFTDIAGHWAETEIERAASLGWVQGDPAGRFHPDAYITRAEAMTMINRVLNRLPEDESDLLDGMNVWPDNRPGTWYYLAVQEATNSHDFTRKGDVHEHWTKLTADPDWSRYQ